MKKGKKSCLGNGDRCVGSDLTCCPGSDGTKYMCDPSFQACEKSHKDRDTCEAAVQCCTKGATCHQESPRVSRCRPPAKKKAANSKPKVKGFISWIKNFWPKKKK